MTVDEATGEIVAVTEVVPARAAERDTFGVLGDAVRLAEVIADTELVPAVLRKRPDAVVAVVLAGHELGLGPMQSLQSIDLIQGRPSLSPEGMRALVLSRGHQLVVEATDTAATVRCHRREWPAEQWTTHTFTIDDADRAGLLGKGSWEKYPRAMLTARATSEACRATFPDVIAGLSYTPEELESVPVMPPAPARPETKADADVEKPPCDDDATETQPPEAWFTATERVLARVDALGKDARVAFDAHVAQMRWPWPPTSGAVIRNADRYLDRLEADR